MTGPDLRCWLSRFIRNSGLKGWGKGLCVGPALSKWNRLSTKGKKMDGLDLKWDCQICVLSRWNVAPLATGGVNREDFQDGGGVKLGDHLLPHKYIKNTPTWGTTPTEHLLHAGRRPQSSQKLCGWQGLGALASCQAWASEVREPSSGHWTIRDLLAQCNINRQDLSQRFHLNAKTQLYSKTSKLQCCTPNAKKLGRQEHKPTHYKRGCLKS